MPRRSYSGKECTEKCLSSEHAKELISAITYPVTAILDKQLASYFTTKCCNFSQVQDSLGRTLLHIAASCGRRDLCIWLCKYYKINIDLADAESGYSALHRSILYGHINIAVSLILLGANLDVKDKENYSPLDLILSERNDFVGAEVYTWGINLNYTSGFGAESSKQYPEYLEFFEKKKETIEEISINTFHTLFVSTSGKVWSCGMGKGGRLGLSSEDTVLIPQQVTLATTSSPTATCVSAAAGQDHSIFLCDDNEILTCGINTYHQLGIDPPPTFINKPQLIKFNQSQDAIVGVAASAYHSVVWTMNVIFTAGLHAGQLGHPNSAELTVPSFKKVAWIDFTHTVIRAVAVNKAVSAVATDTHIFILNDYKNLRIEIKSTLQSQARKGDLYPPKISKLAVIGGKLDSKKIKPFNISTSTEELQVVVQLSNGSLLLWKEKDNRLLNCTFSPRRDVLVRDFALHSKGILVCSRKCELFEVTSIKIADTFAKNDSEFTFFGQHIDVPIRNQCYITTLDKVQNTFRSLHVFADPKGDNFAMIQYRSVAIPGSSPSAESSTLQSDFELLYCETNEFDSFHDIVFQVGGKSFAAHKYILASSSEELIKNEEHEVVIVIDGVHPEIFEQILCYVYTGSCSVLNAGPCSIRIRCESDSQHSVSKSPIKYEDPIKLVTKAAKRFKLNSLVESLKSFRYLVNREIVVKQDDEKCKNRIRFDRNRFRTLYDVVLKSQDGNIFNAHKCVLVARMEYFKMMLSGYWKESQVEHCEIQMPVSSAVLSHILEYLYTDTITRPVEKKNFNLWCHLLVASDQFLLVKLKQIAEQALYESLDTRNVTDILMFADVMHATQLKAACFEFVSVNIPSILYSRTLQKLDIDLLDQLSSFYKHYEGSSCTKVRDISVFSDICDPEDIFAAENVSPIQWDVIYDSFHEEISTNPVEKSKQKKKIKSAQKSSTPEAERSFMTHHRGDEVKSPKVHQTKHDDIRPRYMKEPTPSPEMVRRSQEWVTVDRQVKLVKLRLKANAAAKENPELMEQKENFVQLTLKKISTNDKPLREYKLNVVASDAESSIRSGYTLDINLQNVTPKQSQATKKRLRKVSESAKAEGTQIQSVESPTSSDGSLTVLRDLTSPPPVCWGSPSNWSEKNTSFSSIIALEKKNKTQIKKETKKIETKPLHLTQVEDQAIQELMAFYNVRNVDDELITIRRVIRETSAPLWVTR